MRKCPDRKRPQRPIISHFITSFSALQMLHKSMQPSKHMFNPKKFSTNNRASQTKWRWRQKCSIIELLRCRVLFLYFIYVLSEVDLDVRPPLPCLYETVALQRIWLWRFVKEPRKYMKYWKLTSKRWRHKVG